MTDNNTWFVFDNDGDFLFRTEDLNRTKNIPEIYNVKYIIKNPAGYEPNEDQRIKYNTVTDRVEFSARQVTTDIGNFDEENIIAVSDLLIEIEANKDEINANVEKISTLQLKISELEIKLTNLSITFDNIFPLTLT